MAQGTATRSARTVELRPVSPGRAVLLLAVCAGEFAGRRFVVEGRRVQALRFGRLALLVSFADQTAYDPQSLAHKRADRVWLAAEARLLEVAVERARSGGVVLPMRLLTVFSQTDALERAASESYARWSRALGRLGTKLECLVHLYAGPHAPPGGEPYVLRATRDATRSSRLPPLKAAEGIAAHAAEVWHDCTSLALAARRVHTGLKRGALWSAALLLSQSDIAVLTAVLERSAVAGAALGVTAYLETPRAPFSFV